MVLSGELDYDELTLLVAEMTRTCEHCGFDSTAHGLEWDRTPGECPTKEAVFASVLSADDALDVLGYGKESQ